MCCKCTLCFCPLDPPHTHSSQHMQLVLLSAGARSDIHIHPCASHLSHSSLTHTLSRIHVCSNTTRTQLTHTCPNASALRWAHHCGHPCGTSACPPTSTTDTRAWERTPPRLTLATVQSECINPLCVHTAFICCCNISLVICPLIAESVKRV